MNRLVIILTLGISTAMQAAVIYTDGPAFPAPVMLGSHAVDINNDGSPDFVFRADGALATFNLPSSGSSWTFKFDAVGSNQFLVSDYVLIQPLRSWIAANSPTNSAWSAPGASATLTSHWQRDNEQEVREGWNGSLGALREGYLGVRVYASDGLRYGWIHVRLPKPETDPNGLQPIIIDWAFETQTDTPILTGYIAPKIKSNHRLLDTTTNGDVKLK